MIGTSGTFDQPDTAGKMHKGDSDNRSSWPSRASTYTNQPPRVETLFDAVSSPGLDRHTKRREILMCFASLKPIKELPVRATWFTFMEDADILFGVVTYLRKRV
jgi:hypothetical protein